MKHMYYRSGVLQMRCGGLHNHTQCFCPWHNSRSNGKSISEITGYETARRLRNIYIIIEKV
jgi:hypothetical protein